MAALASGDNISSVKLTRITQQSMAMLKNLKTFFNLQFKIKECEDDVFEPDSDEQEEIEADF